MCHRPVILQLRPGDPGRHVHDPDVPAAALPAPDTHYLDTEQQLPRAGSGDHVPGGEPASEMRHQERAEPLPAGAALPTAQIHRSVCREGPGGARATGAT